MAIGALRLPVQHRHDFGDHQIRELKHRRYRLLLDGSTLSNMPEGLP